MGRTVCRAASRQADRQLSPRCTAGYPPSRGSPPGVVAGEGLRRVGGSTLAHNSRAGEEEGVGTCGGATGHGARACASAAPSCAWWGVLPTRRGAAGCPCRDHASTCFGPPPPPPSPPLPPRAVAPLVPAPPPPLPSPSRPGGGRPASLSAAVTPTARRSPPPSRASSFLRGPSRVAAPPPPPPRASPLPCWLLCALSPLSPWLGVETATARRRPTPPPPWAVVGAAAVGVGVVWGRLGARQRTCRPALRPST